MVGKQYSVACNISSRWQQASPLEWQAYFPPCWRVNGLRACTLGMGFSSRGSIKARPAWGSPVSAGRCWRWWENPGLFSSPWRHVSKYNEMIPADFHPFSCMCEEPLWIHLCSVYSSLNARTWIYQPIWEWSVEALFFFFFMSRKCIQESGELITPFPHVWKQIAAILVPLEESCLRGKKKIPKMFCS